MRFLDQTMGHMATLLAGHGLRLVLGLISSIILARGLGPEGLSLFSVVGAAMTIAITIGDFGLGNSAVRHIAGALTRQPEQARQIARIFAKLKLLGSTIIVAAILILSRPIAALLRLPPDVGPLLVQVGALGVLATSLSGIVSTVLQSLARFTALVGTQTLNILSTVMLMAILYAAGRLTVLNALYVGAATALVAALFGFWLLPAHWRTFKRLPQTPAGDEARRLWRFGRWVWVSTILTILATELDLLLLNSWSTPEAVGLYALALNLSFKAQIVNQSLHAVLLPQASALAGRQRIVAYIRHSFGRGLLFALLLALALPFARPLIILLYGTTYAGSVNLFYLLMIVVLFSLIVDPLILLAYPLDLPRLITIAALVRVVVMVVTAALLIPVWGMYGAAIAKLLSKVSSTVVAAVVIAAYLPKSLDEEALEA